MQHLLEIPTDYWAIYINADSSESDAPTVQAQAYFGEFRCFDSFLLGKLYSVPFFGMPYPVVGHHSRRSQIPANFN